MDLMDSPEFPLTVTSHLDRDAWTFADEDELVNGLPLFDSDDPAHASSVIDGRGRPVRLVIVNREVTVLELVAGWPSLEP